MHRLLKLSFVALAFGTFIGHSADALARTDGVLLVGTAAEVREALRGTRLNPVFTASEAQDLVAVRLTDGRMTVYEGEAVGKILDFVGHVVEGCVTFTLKAGSALWDFLEQIPPTSVKLVKKALKAAAWILSSGATLVVDGVTWTLKSSAEILRAVADLLKSLVGG